MNSQIKNFKEKELLSQFYNIVCWDLKVIVPPGQLLVYCAPFQHRAVLILADLIQRITQIQISMSTYTRCIRIVIMCMVCGGLLEAV